MKRVTDKKTLFVELIMLIGSCAFSGCNALSSAVFARRSDWGKKGEGASVTAEIDVSDAAASVVYLTDNNIYWNLHRLLEG